MEISGQDFRIDGDFRLATLLECKLADHAEDIEELCDGAQKQLGIEQKMIEVKERWAAEEFQFATWKDKKVPVLRAVGPILEDLDEAQLQCQTQLTMRHVKPFKGEVTDLLTKLSDTTDTLERWLKVQQLWCSLESVFTGGDIAKQMPVEAKKFNKIDKEFSKIMAKAQETGLVVECCEKRAVEKQFTCHALGA